MPRFNFVLVLVALAFFTISCGSDSPTPGYGDVMLEDYLPPPDSGPQLTLETDLSAVEVSAGESLTVTCFAEQDGSRVELETKVEITGAEGTQTVDPGALALEVAGAYEVACVSADGAVRDETPEDLTVNPGQMVRMVTGLDKNEINAGDAAVATCTAEDAHGNTWEETPGVVAEPAEGVAILDQEITGEKPGAYVISCVAEKGVEVVPADLTVVEGVPAKFIASVAPETVTAAEYATVSCAVEDVQGNPVACDWEVVAPEEVTVAGDQIFSTVADSYKIKCGPVEELGDVDQVAATWTVEPGEPVDMLIYPKPDKDQYCVGDQVEIKHELVDEYGNVVDDGEIEPIDVDPATGMLLQNEKIDKYNFLDEGTYSLSVKSVEGGYSGEVELICDCTGPSITITYPPRGITLQGPTNIVVTGYVADTVSGVTSLTVNGDDVSIDAQGGFNYPMELGHGMNLVRAEALDGLGNLGKRFRSPFYSTDYALADSANPVAGLLDKAIVVYLSQEFIDDGDHSDPPDDLASVVEKMFADFDFTGLLPQEGIEIMDGWTAYLTNVDMGQPQLSLQAVDGGIHLIMSIPDLTADIEVESCYELPIVGEVCDNMYGIIYAETIVAEVYLFIGIAEDGSIEAYLGPLSVEIEGLDVDIEGILGSLFDPLVNMLVNVLKDSLIQQFQDEFGVTLPQLVKDALESLAEGQVIELPPLIGEGDPTELLLSLEFQLLQFTYNGLDLILRAGITSEKAIEHNPLGALLRDGCMGTETEPFFLTQDTELDLGLLLDFGNEALYSVWYSGAITLDLTAEDLGDLDVSQYGIEDLALSTDLNYAPILQTCGLDGGMELAVGDAFVHAEFTMMGQFWDIDIYLYLVLEATPALITDEETGNIQIGIEVGELKVAEVDVVAVGEDLKGKEDMVENLFTGMLIPTLMDELLGGLGGFDLPSFDLSSFSDAIPEGTEISVDLQKLGIVNGYLSAGGKLK